jgi:hypothetical protein
MNIDTSRVRDCLKSFGFRNLFVEELGWNICDNRPVDVQIDTQTFCLTPFAEQGGMVIYLGESPVDGIIPPSNIRRVIETRITKLTHEHMVIFVNKEQTRSVWQWVRRQQGKQTTAREHTYYKGQPGDSLLQKLAGIAFSIDDLDEEGRVAIAEVTGRVTKAFDVEKVTRRFYDEFKKEHSNFSKFLTGMEGQDELSWYTSVMLDRIMFIYFIQKKGFLDGDTDYLANKLRESKARGANQFYRKFLVRLFFEGFAKEDKERSPEVNQLLGKVPYLNGGLFLPHQLELAHKENINIADSAFEQLFAFFDRYSWHLDYRPSRADNEINPDILGYIFEKYVNQKQMGAYYTKEDITDYICKNTIIPFLFDKLESMRYDELHPFPIKDVEPYIYEAVKQEDYLPTETKREYQARQNRYQQIRADFAAGKISSINDLVTYNLDIRKFAEDWVREINDPVTLRAFYFHCLTKVTILDPTVGSGAFLFAALNLLEPLYEICLDKMAELGGPKYPDFAQELERVRQHPNRKYFVLKSIIVNNLFGVDIMEEAVEICKLRLFLKLVSQVDDVDKIEPLPDIDFNIRAGNSLVGYATYEQTRKAVLGELQGKFDMENNMERIERSAAIVDRAFQNFRNLQTRISMNSRELAKAKEGLRQDLSKLEDELNRYLAGEYGTDTKNSVLFEKWLTTHHPFHWFVEFYGTMKSGGFDVVIGNPPYVAAAKVRKQYNVKNLLSLRCPDIYAWILERNQALLRIQGRTGMIVPLSLGFSTDFAPIREVLYNGYGRNWFSSFGRIPSALFSFDVRVRNTIHLGLKDETGHSNYTTRLHRWFEAARTHLFATLEYSAFIPELWKGRVPKLNTNALASAFEQCLRATKSTFEAATYPHATTHILHFKKTAYNWLDFCRKLPPCYEDGRLVEHTKFGQMYFSDVDTCKLAMLLGNGKLAFVFWCALGDDFDVTRWNIGEFPIDFCQLRTTTREELLKTVPVLEQAMDEAIQFKLNAGRRVGNYNLAKCRHITDLSDRIFAQTLGLSQVWEDIELYYSQVVKTDFSNDMEETE